jgi:Ala-tRNA(Pro) deacylase
MWYIVVELQIREENKMNCDRIIYKTRPADKRSAEEDAVYDVLEKLDIQFERLDWAPEDEGSENVYETLGIMRLKNLLLCNAQKTNFYLLVMPADVPFKSSVLSKQLGTSRFSFAPEEFLLEFLHAKSGCASILGLIFDKNKKVQLVIDERVLEEEYFGCLPCADTSSIKFNTKELLDKLLSYTGHFYTVVRM